MASQTEDSDNGGAGGQASPGDAGDFGDGAEEPIVTVVDAPRDLEAELAVARAESAANFDRYLRAKAELDNVLKRQQRELADRARFEGEALCRDLLPVIDGLEGALAHAGSGDSAGLAGGVELVLKAMLATLTRHGVERIDAEGKPFDPAEHEAVSTFETPDTAPNTVYAVHRAGYRLRDRLLRAAMVTVAKAPAAAPDQASTQGSSAAS